MDEKEWICFEKTGKVADYLAYCQSASGKFADFGHASTSEFLTDGDADRHQADFVAEYR